ncbi:MAG: hypothetical protein KatS3mg076_1079 [Candidatus Binatia bacterium]|nr:MAG: hypothetical protein KatS3mg076_1079 [Candidatus Binatia bacterium]
MPGLRDAYDTLLESVSKPSRYLGNEVGAVRKDPNRVSIRFALAFPDVYEIAQSHPGLQILYDLLNRRPDVYAERVYAPWFDMEHELRRRNLPLASLETCTPLHEFSIVGFSLQYELTYTNVLCMLDLGRIPLRSSERGPRDPLVLAGGPCAFHPEPLAPFLDAVLLGDGEEAVYEICDVYAAWNKKDRRELLEALAAIRGVYVPSFFQPEYKPDGTLERIVRLAGPEKVEKRVLSDLNRVPIQKTFVVPNAQVVHDRPSLEVMRGCVKGCRFCQAGYTYRPLRDRSPARVLEQAEEALKRTGAEELSLLSLSTGDYSCVNPVLTELMNRFSERKVAISLPSTRVDALAPSLLEQIRRVRKTGFTLAPEAGTQRMRDIIQKEYTEEELLEAARQLFELGWQGVKLYFMIGLPGEREEDVVGIAELCERVARVGKGRKEVVASVSTFVPKPHTPFQWVAQIPLEETLARQELLRRELRRRRIRFRWHDARESVLEGIFSRGDRRLAEALLRAYRAGCRFDGWSDHLRFDLWERALAESGLEPSFYLRRRLLTEVLPWDHLSCGVTKSFLQRELARAFARELTPDCSIERCTYCGVCDFRHVRNVTYHLRGAKGGEHRGREVLDWARSVVPGEDEASWEPRGWHVAQRKKSRESAGTGRDRVRPPARLRTASPGPDSRRPGKGTAQEWLEAGSQSLVPELPEAPPPVQKLRVRYEKLGPARFLGNREIVTSFVRAARRADLPLAYSRGHHPLPRMSFSPALPVGTESESEFVEMELRERRPPAVVGSLLDAELPEGLRVREVLELPPAAPSVESEISGFRYEVSFLDPVDGAELGEKLRRFESCPVLWLERKSGKGRRRVDARSFVERVASTGNGKLLLDLRFGPSGTPRPSEVMELLWGGAPLPRFRVRKVRTLFRTETEGTPREAAGEASAG